MKSVIRKNQVWLLFSHEHVEASYNFLVASDVHASCHGRCNTSVIRITTSNVQSSLCPSMAGKTCGCAGHRLHEEITEDY